MSHTLTCLRPRIIVTYGAVLSGVLNMTDDNARVVMEEITDPVEIAEAEAQWVRFDRNAAWLHAHADEIYNQHRGKFICIAGEEPFAADSATEALKLGEAAHPDDKGRFVHYIPKDKVPRIYAN